MRRSQVSQPINCCKRKPVLAPALNSSCSGSDPVSNLLIIVTGTLLARDKYYEVSPDLALFVVRGPRAEIDVDEELPEHLWRWVVEPKRPPHRREVAYCLHDLEDPPGGLPILASNLQ